MSSNLKSALQEDMKQSMKSGDKNTLSAIRLILATIKQKELDDQVVLDDDQIIASLDKMLKQRRESIKQFEQAGRDDLIAKEQSEIDVIYRYLPEQLSEDALIDLIQKAITNSGAQSMKDMQKVMADLMPKIKGRADMAFVSKKIKEHLTGT